MKKVISALLVLSLIFAFAACGKEQEETVTTTLPDGFEVAEDNTTAKADGTDTDKETEESTEPEEENKLPEALEDVVAKYKEVMDQAKKDKPGFDRLDYQELPSGPEYRVISSGEGLMNAALTFAGNFMATRKEAEKKPTVGVKGGNMDDFPVKHTNYGCLLKGTDGVKSAKCEELSNGYWKITMILYSEKNPEPAAPGATVAPSYHGSICSPISKKEIDSKLASGLFKDIEYSLTYHDCETVLIFNPENNHIYMQEQTNRVTITGKGSIGLITLGIDKQELINHVVIQNLKY